MTNAALDISANKHNCRVERTKTLLNLPFDFVLPLPPSLPSVTCLFLSSVLFLSQMSHVFLFLPTCEQDIGLSFSFSLSLSLSFFPPRRLAQSLLCVRKQTQIILGALLACDRGLASRFKWEHMEIITANWHMHELACPPGKSNERHTNSRLTQLTAPQKHSWKGNLLNWDTAGLVLMMLWHGLCSISSFHCVTHTC